MKCNFAADYLTRVALHICVRQNTAIQRPLMKFMIEWLLVSRGRELIHATEETTSKIYDSIIEQILENGPVIRTLKLTYFFNNTVIDFKSVQDKYENKTKAKLMPLLENICSLTGTGKKEQEELFKKMTIYICALNKLFNTKNSQMVCEANCALHSIQTTRDLLDFVTRKKRYRLEYLDNLGKIMCGILIFNKHIGMGGEAIRDVVNDVHVAFQNTLESLRHNMTKCNELVTIGLRAVSRIVCVNLKECKLVYKLPDGITIEDVRLFNKFNYLHLQLEVFLHQLKEPLDKLKLLIEQSTGKFKEIIFMLHDVVKFRLAVPTELVFPHFTELFNKWYQILMQLYFLVDINKINDEMMEIVSTDYPFEEMASKISSKESIKTLEFSLNYLVTAQELHPITLKPGRKFSFFANPLQRFCALTMAVTGGILVQAETIFGVLPFQEQFIAFKRKDFAVFAEKNHSLVAKYFLRSALLNPEMCLIFNISIESSPLSGSFQNSKPSQTSKKKTSDTGLQTEHCLPPATGQSRITYSWNIWDYRRRAIQLCNLMQCRTHSAQTNITFSSKDATIQTYDKISSTHRDICSSSQWSKSVCHILDETEKEKTSNCPSAKCPPENQK